MSVHHLGTRVNLNLDSRRLGQKCIHKVDLRQLSPRGEVEQMFEVGSKIQSINYIKGRGRGPNVRL